MRSLVERKLNSSCVYKGNSVSFFRDTVLLPNKKRAIRDYMRHPGAVCAVAFKNRRQVLVLRQHRYPVAETIMEIPAGKIDTGENPLVCARRELLEETGYWPKKIKRILSFWPTPAFATEVMHIYLAWDLEKREANPEHDEFLEVFWMDFEEALELVKVGKIRDAKSVIALLAVKTFNLNPYPPIT